jgi:two-component system, OmpR family, phosphate regulon sensor histidine kinase PhoR
MTDRPARSMLGWQRALEVMGRVALGVVVVASGFSLAYFITSRGYRALAIHPTPYLIALTTLGVAFLFTFSVGLIANRRVLRWNPWDALLDAVRRLSLGDFSVRVDVATLHDAGPVREPLQQLATSLNVMAQELGETERMRREFVANVSHEIQSPLAAVLGYVETLKRDDLADADRARCLDVIETEARRLSRLSENLLRLSALESGARPIHPAAFRLDRQLREVLIACEPLWLGRSVDVELAGTAGDGEAPPSVELMGDEDLLSQVWLNLVTNAVKFTGPGGRVRVELGADDAWATVCVADTGIGIEAGALPHIFERFYKADPARDRSQGGSGLGLAIVRRIVDLHAGEVAVDSQPGRGTRVRVRLPLASPPAPA